MNSTTRKRTNKTLASIAGLALLAVPLAACGSEDDNDTSSSSNSSSSSATSVPEPVASIGDLSTDGGTTAVKLDPDTLKALEGLKVTPGVSGTAKLEDGSIIFPITGGNVTVFKPGAVSPYVIGQIQHEGSGLSLAAGGTKVELTNLNVDPGVSRVYGDVTVNGKVAATSAYLFKLDGRTLKPLQSGEGTATLQGTKVVREASKDEPAYLIEQADGDKVIKSASEISPI